MAAKTNWDRCPECQRERRLTAEGVLVEHRAYFGERIGMLDCSGSGQPPAMAEEITAA
jgi:hypothetical protein